MTDDPFDNPDAGIQFDDWGRYKLPNPQTGQWHSWTRCTTFARSIADSFALSQWSQRMTAKGLSMRPDLVQLAAALDVSADKDLLNRLVEQAKDAAGAKVAADTGTAIHTFAEETDAGNMSIDAVPKAHRSGVVAYREALRAAGMTVRPDLQERAVCVPLYGVAGRLDKVVREADGAHAIGDVKSGKNPSLSALEIAIQLAIYAHGLNGAGVWDLSAERWEDPGVRVRTDYAVVMHMPAGKGVCALHKVDIEAGWEAAQLCWDVRERRKIKGLFTPYK